MIGSSIRQTKFYPFCSSDRCSKRRVEGELKTNIIGMPIDCPDCGSSLFWSKIPKVRHKSPTQRTLTGDGKFKHKTNGNHF
jgi:DNA-directed RNA polymerase subunit RPC12/RpoP